MAPARALLLAAAVTWGPGPALAHGDRDHGTDAAVREQKPWGIAGDPKAVTRTVAVGMTDAMRFVPQRLEARQGDTVRFRIRNDGKLMHEFVLGTRRELDRHAELMRKFPNMEHDEPYMAHVGPGRQAEIVWTFNRAGNFLFACLVAGHYQAGMIGRIRVTARAAEDKPAAALR